MSTWKAALAYVYLSLTSTAAVQVSISTVQTSFLSDVCNIFTMVSKAFFFQPGSSTQDDHQDHQDGEEVASGQSWGPLGVISPAFGESG